MSTVLLIILAYFFPPFAVALKDGFRFNFWVNVTLYIALIFLTIFLTIPFAGLLPFAHAVLIILQD